MQYERHERRRCRLCGKTERQSLIVCPAQNTGRRFPKLLLQPERISCILIQRRPTNRQISLLVAIFSPFLRSDRTIQFPTLSISLCLPKILHLLRRFSALRLRFQMPLRPQRQPTKLPLIDEALERICQLKIGLALPEKSRLEMSSSTNSIRFAVHSLCWQLLPEKQD